MTSTPEFDPEYVRDISLDVYLERLGPDSTAKAVAEVGMDVIRKRAVSYDPLTKAYLRAIGKHAPTSIMISLDPEDMCHMVKEVVQISPVKSAKQRSKSASSIAKSAKITK